MEFPALAPKPIDRWLTLVGFAVSSIIVLFPRTPALVSGVLLVSFACLVHPIWKFWWIEDYLPRQIFGLVVLASILVWIGFKVPMDTPKDYILPPPSAFTPPTGYIPISPITPPRVTLPPGTKPPELKAKTRTKPQPPPVINMEAPYGNLAARCEDLGSAIVSYADGQLNVRPERKPENLEDYNQWIRISDGMFRARAEQNVNDLHADLLGRYIKDPQLEELLQRSREVYQFRNGPNMEHCVRNSQSPLCYLSVADIREIGERFVYLSTQIKR
jgi:hypothetical protein